MKAPTVRGSVSVAAAPCSPEERRRRLASLARRLEAIRQRLAAERAAEEPAAGEERQ